MSHHILAGKRWELVYENLPRGTDGLCDPPDQSHKKIHVRRSLYRDPQGLLETLIHEGLHACAFPLAEEVVAEAAEDIARLLISQGFRLEVATPPPSVECSKVR